MDLNIPYVPTCTNAERRWPYYQYYFGKEDEEQRRDGDGENHWSGTESLEWYRGKFVRDMMHGPGVYRWRYKGPEEVFFSYEGQFYGNRMHGYGAMSYPDGRVFNGLFYGNLRWGPGVESNPRLQENVGLWRGNQLVRLTWRPQTASVAPDLNFTPTTKTIMETYRTLLTTRIQSISEFNSDIELLKQSGAEPLTASKRWTELYPKTCTDLASQLCQVDVFDQEYYKNKIMYLEEVDVMPERTKEVEDGSHKSENGSLNTVTFYAWNNNKIIIDMMKHCFKHEHQRSKSGINLQIILTGARRLYKPAAKHEINCRTLIMASYLGHIICVARLVNEADVYPDVADILGNTALMYATCGDRADIIHFLVEAGANVNSFNDSCCTPLGVALLRFAWESNYITTGARIQALVPPLSPGGSPRIVPSTEEKPSEWHMTRDLPFISPTNLLTKSLSKQKMNGQKKARLSADESATGAVKKKPLVSTTPRKDKEMDDDDTNDMSSDEKRLFHTVNTEFNGEVADTFYVQKASSPAIPYLFEVKNMVEEVIQNEDKQKKEVEKSSKKVSAKSIKEPVKPSAEKLWQSAEKNISLNSTDNKKIETLGHIMSTILQLLSDGADPRLVRCPQPALWIAVASGSSDLVRHLVEYGADVNEVNPNIRHYSILDAAVSLPLTHENLTLVQTILEAGASADHRLKYEVAGNDQLLTEHPGPNLLHAVVAKNPVNDIEEEIRCQLVELLLEYNCNALTQFNGSSAIEMAMMYKFSLLEIFVKSSKIDLNAVINGNNQNILVKMFTLDFSKTIPVTERLNILTQLLLYGADPLLECQDENRKFTNIFVFAYQNLCEHFNYNMKPDVSLGSKTPNPVKGKKGEKNIREKQSSKAPLKYGLDEFANYKQALDLLTDCARLLYIRWIQAKLLKELIQVVVKFVHRHWNMILPEYNNKNACGLWLTCSRSLEIWDILETAKKKSIKDKRVLKHVLCIVSFSASRSKSSFVRPLTTIEKSNIESNVSCILREHKTARDNMASEQIHWARPYVTPELDLSLAAERKFQVCFECALPFEVKIPCIFCEQVSFCSMECMRMNIDHVGSHPCSENLMKKYFPTAKSSSEDDV